MNEAEEQEKLLRFHYFRTTEIIKGNSLYWIIRVFANFSNLVELSDTSDLKTNHL